MTSTIGTAASANVARPPCYPACAVTLPPGTLCSGRYQVQFARGLDDLLRVQRMRLEHGRPDARSTGRPLAPDLHDWLGHHVFVEDTHTDRIIATCRVSTSELSDPSDMAANRGFHLQSLPAAVLAHGMEVGRVVVSPDHGEAGALEMLWQGLVRYADWNDQRYLFGACPFPGLDAAEVASLSLKLARASHLHRRVRVPVRQEAFLHQSTPLRLRAGVATPALMQSFLSMGGRVCSGPAVDHEAGQASFLLLLDLRDTPRSLLQELGGPGDWHLPGAETRALMA